jgi:predicted MFS family arabinose efflux permease
VIGWRNIFLITGSIGVLTSIMIFFFVRDRTRGASEPELSQLEELKDFRFKWRDIKALWKIKSLLLLIAHGFVALFIWNMLVFWLFHYLKAERGYTDIAAMVTMLLVNLALVIGYFAGGFFGDQLFRKYKRGRMMVASIGTICGGATLVTAFFLPISTLIPFLFLLFISGIFLSSVSPNLVASVHDITLPEVRSSAQAFRQLFIDMSAAAAPFVAGLIAVRTSLHQAILSASLVSWIVATGLVLLITFSVSKDIDVLRGKLKTRADQYALNK